LASRLVLGPPRFRHLGLGLALSRLFGGPLGGTVGLHLLPGFLLAASLDLRLEPRQLLFGLLRAQIGACTSSASAARLDAASALRCASSSTRRFSVAATSAFTRPRWMPDATGLLIAVAGCSH
jgi:hypothetical protein